jgi:hypothetical protein
MDPFARWQVEDINLVKRFRFERCEKGGLFTVSELIVFGTAISNSSLEVIFSAEAIWVLHCANEQKFMVFT